MTTLVINKEETFSMIFTPEMPIGRGRIIKTHEAYKMAMDSIKNGTAEKTCDTETTLMYQIKDRPLHEILGYSSYCEYANDARNHM